MAKRERYTEHPSITVINSTPKLRVFEDFFIEENLPKWRKIKIRIDAEDKASRDGKQYFEMASGPFDRMNGSISDRRSERDLISGAKHERRSYVNRAADRLSIERAAVNTQKKSWFGRIIDRFLKEKEADGQPVEQVFEQVKTEMVSPTNEDIIRSRKILDTVEGQLRMSGQYEIADRLKGSSSVFECELALAASGNLKYISEEQIVKLMLASERGIRLEYLRYYSDILPSEVARRKIVFDGLLVFDNYCVLHYDPGVPKFSLIKEAADDAARLKRRDPILFGMIKGSRKLYYVADWVTNDDDLTLEKLETIIGEKALDLGNDVFIGTNDTVSNLLSRVQVNINTDIEIAANQGRLITEENMMHFIQTGEVPEPLKRELKRIGVREDDLPNGTKRRHKKRHHR